MNKKNQRTLSLCLGAIYLVLLAAIILFKFPFKGEDFGSTRAIELIPFYVAEIKNVSFFQINLVYNVLFFIPVGVYTCLLKPDWGVARKIVPAVLLSLTFEVLQFVLGIGISDITDLITNTIGGGVGILLYFLGSLVFDKKTQLVVNIAALGLTIVMAVLFAVAWSSMIR